MTRFECCKRITEMKEQGYNILMIIPEEVETSEMPTYWEIVNATKDIEPYETEPTVVRFGAACISSIATCNEDNKISQIVDKIFEMAGVNSVWGIFFC